MSRSKVAAAVGAAFAALAVALVLRPVLLAAGLPAFNHDWTWPPDLIAATSLLQQSASISTRANFGSINYFAGAAPLWAMNALYSSLFGVVLGLKLFLLSVLLGAALAAYRMARTFGASRPVSWACAIFYAASPVVANELAAGHVGYLLGYACLPAIAACGRRISQGVRLRAILGLVVLLPLSCVQPQFGVMDAVVLLLLLFSRQGTRPRAILAAAAFCALLASPYAVVAALFTHPLQALSFDRANVHWEAANSSAFYPSFIGAGYSAGYDALAPRALLQLRGICGIALWGVALLAAWRSRRVALPFVLVAAGAALFSSGINGPAWAFVSRAFVLIPQLALFRELYHLSGLIVLCLIAAIACVRAASVRAASIVAALLVLSAGAQFFGSFWSAVHWYDPAQIKTLAAIVAADKVEGFVLYWPLLQPVARGTGETGADPDAFSIGRHPSLNEFIPIQPLSQFETMLMRSPDIRQTLANFGIRYVVIRKTWRSAYFSNIEPHLRDVLAGRAPAAPQGENLERALRIVWRGADHDLAVVDAPAPFASSSHPTALYRLDVRVPFEPDRENVDPSVAWTDATRWQWWDPAFFGPVNPGVFALQGVPFELPPWARPGSVYLNAPRGAALEGAGPVRRVAPTHGFQRVFVSAEVIRITPFGPAMLAGIANAPLPQSEPLACARVNALSDTEYEIQSLECPTISPQVFSLPNMPWSMRGPDGRTVDPLANTWNLAWRARAGTYRLTYDPPAALEVGLILQYTTWTAAIGAFLMLAFLRRARE